MRRRKTDYGTVALHWMLVGALGVAFFSGMRIASETPGRSWINWFDSVLPHSWVWTAHMQAAVVLIAVTIAYAIYVVRSGLTRRIQLDRTRVRGLVDGGHARRGAINILLYWVFFATMVSLIVTGSLMYVGYFAGHDAMVLHWYGTWIIVAFIGLHVLTHYRLGGASQLLRIFRPTDLPTPPPKLDAAELLRLLVERVAADEAVAQPGHSGADHAPLRPAARTGPANDGIDTSDRRERTRSTTRSN